MVLYIVNLYENLTSSKNLIQKKQIKIQRSKFKKRGVKYKEKLNNNNLKSRQIKII